MPLPPPNEHLLFTTKLSNRTQRLSGSYNGSYDVRNWYTETWFKKDRDWVRVPKGSRHTTNPYTSYVFTADPAGQYSFTWSNRFSVGYYVFAYDYCKHSGDLVMSGDIQTWLSTRVPVSSTHALLTTVRNSVLKQAGGQQFNAALFAAEAHKTLDLLVTNAAKIARSFREIRTGRILRRPLKETVRRALSAIGVVHSKRWDPKASRASQWLEYRYGVETLMMDVRDAAEYAASKMSDQPERFKWRSQKSESSSVTLDYPVDFSLLGTIQSGCLLSPERTFQTKTTAKAWLEAELEVAGYRTMQQLGFANPVGLAWELIPLSFVADWAFNIGSYLELQSSLWGLKVLDAGYSLQCDGYVVMKARPAPGNIPSGSTNQPYMNPVFTGTNTRSFKASRYQRWAWVNPSPEYTLGSGLNVKRAIDTVSLLFVGFKR